MLWCRVTCAVLFDQYVVASPLLAPRGGEGAVLSCCEAYVRCGAE